jgi:hypothetical protein
MASHGVKTGTSGDESSGGSEATVARTWGPAGSADQQAVRGSCTKELSCSLLALRHGCRTSDTRAGTRG